VKDFPVSSSSRWTYRRDRPSATATLSRSMLQSLKRRAIYARIARVRAAFKPRVAMISAASAVGPSAAATRSTR
jgi:hypothetical protein